MSVRVFIAPERLAAGPLVVSGDEHHYVVNVRRQAVGATVCLLDGAGRWAEGNIVSIGNDSTELLVSTPKVFVAPPFSLAIVPALIKGERMDQAITKLVELGVSQIHPVTTERTVVRLKGNRAESRLARFESLAKAASRQSRNPQATHIAPIQSLETFLKAPPKAELMLIPEASGNAPPLEEVLPQAPPSSAMVLIGPEGGFSPEELGKAQDAGFTPASLGPRVLRAETACIAIASILGFRYGDVGSI